MLYLRQCEQRTDGGGLLPPVSPALAPNAAARHRLAGTKRKRSTQARPAFHPGLDLSSWVVPGAGVVGQRVLKQGHETGEEDLCLRRVSSCARRRACWSSGVGLRAPYADLRRLVPCRRRSRRRERSLRSGSASSSNLPRMRALCPSREEEAAGSSGPGSERTGRRQQVRPDRACATPVWDESRDRESVPGGLTSASRSSSTH